MSSSIPLFADLEELWRSGYCDVVNCLENTWARLDGVCLCLRHTEEMFERFEAIHIYPDMRELLEPLPLRPGARWTR